MRPSILALLLTATPALADGDLVGRCAGDTYATCPVNLTAGDDYDFHAPEADGSSTLRLLDPSGNEVFGETAPSDGNDSTEIRARVTGTYRLEVRSDPERPAGGAAIELYTDCRADASTRCSLKPGGKASGATTGSPDTDGYLVRLPGGRRYVLSFGAGYGDLSCASGYHRKNHKGEFTIFPRNDTTCLFDISRAQGPYSLSVR